MEAVDFLCDIRFHRSFVLAADAARGRSKPFRVSYADYGDSRSDAVVLFCGALMATRFCYSPIDGLAKAYNIRIIHPDRPGIGGTDPVDLHERIALWLEIVPQLLKHLNISRIAIASHSGGAIYALNTILTYPNLLHSQTPYITFFAPWVHHSHSGKSHLRATDLLPAPLIGRFASMVRFVNNNVVPLANLSGGVMRGIKDSFHSPTPALAPVPVGPLTPTNTFKYSRTASIASHLDFLDLDDPKIVEELRHLITEYLFAESIDGISDDAKLFLRKPSSLLWCSPDIFWSDVDCAVPLLSQIIDESSVDGYTDRDWIIDVFHAQTDNMVGEKGRAWFDGCWVDPQTTSKLENISFESTKCDQRRRNYDYRSEVVSNSEHNYIMDPGYGAVEEWLRRVREAFPPLQDTNHEGSSSSSAALSVSRVIRAQFHAMAGRTKRVAHSLRLRKNKAGASQLRTREANQAMKYSNKRSRTTTMGGRTTSSSGGMDP